MPIGDVYQARIVADNDLNQVSFNIVHFLTIAEAGTGATLIQIATAIDAAIAADFKALLCQQCFYHGVGITKLRPVRGVEIAYTGSFGAGTGAANGLPGQVSGLISLYTLTPGRKGRGRMYVPFPGVSDANNNGEVVAGYKTRLANLAGVLFVGFTPGAGGNTTTLSPVLYNKALFTTTLITGQIPRQKFATQRRRGDYGRTNIAPF